MIALPSISPDEAVLHQLAQWQQEIDSQPTYPAQVETAAKKWTAHNRPDDATFQEIKQLLSEMGCGGQGCGYCEDSIGYQIEHIWPKALYPEQTFSWLNYLYACGRCNLAKLAHFAVFTSASEGVTKVGRAPGAKVVPPPAGDPVLIDPRGEDPMRFLQLDLQGTFLLMPITTLSPREKARAEYTRTLLPLNLDPLPRRRRDAYGNYCARLKEYAATAQQGASADELERLRDELLQLGHPTVFREMQRQHGARGKHQALFAQVPAAVSW